MKTTKDSLNWLTEPSVSQSQYYRPYFCESCLIVASSPTKHCKLCEACCSKFDHHCLFINKCVGLKNHRPFMWFLIVTISCTVYFLYNVYSYFVDFSVKLEEKNMLKSANEKYSLVYYMFTMTNQLWLAMLFLMNCLTVMMVSFLLYFQLRFVTLGFTSQFQPPVMFHSMNKQMNNIKSAFIHRMNNLHSFFFKSFEANEELYYKQLNDYYTATNGNKTIALGGYPTQNSEKNQFLTNYPMNTDNNGSNMNSKAQYEIDLD